VKSLKIAGCDSQESFSDQAKSLFFNFVCQALNSGSDNGSDVFQLLLFDAELVLVILEVFVRVTSFIDKHVSFLARLDENIDHTRYAESQSGYFCHRDDPMVVVENNHRRRSKSRSRRFRPLWKRRAYFCSLGTGTISAIVKVVAPPW
jgi:hypothetical protein